MVLIPGWWSRTARRRGPGVRHPIRPGRSGGAGGERAPGSAGPPHGAARGAPEEEAAGLPRVPWAFGGLGEPALRGEEPAERPVRRGQGGDQRHPESPPAGGAGQRGYPADPDHPAPAGGGGTTWTWSSPWGCCSCWGWRMTGRRRSKGGELLLKCCGAPFRPAAERWCRGAGLDGRIGGHAVEQLLPLQSLRGDEQPALHADPVAVHPLPAGGGYLHIDAGDAPPGVVVAGAGDLLRVRVQHGLTRWGCAGPDRQEPPSGRGR